MSQLDDSSNVNLAHASHISSSSTDSGYENGESPYNSNNNAAAADHAASTALVKKAASRRGHFKSRLGCFNCKRRRVKCNELRPSCTPCKRLKLSCAYPATPAPTWSGSIRANPSMLTLEDLRFYHQFLTTAFPTLPLRSDDVWQQCAAMSHQYDFLAHAILGLGASHLTLHANVDYTSRALQHRLAAIKHVNEQLSNPPTRSSDADALFATVLCLVTQSSLVQDGMADYITMVRGGDLVAIAVIPDITKSVFRPFTHQGHLDAVCGVVSEEPKDWAKVEEFTASVKMLKPLITTSYERRYYDALLDVVQALRSSSKDAWFSFCTLYRVPALLTHEEFHTFVNPACYSGRLLIMHMFLLDYLLGQFCISPNERIMYSARKSVVISWGRSLARSIPSRYQPYVQWIDKYCDELKHRDARYLLSP